MKTESQTLPEHGVTINLEPLEEGLVQIVPISSQTIVAEFSKISQFLSKKELRRPRSRPLTGTELKRLAKRNPPPPEWYEGEEERPF